VGQRGTADGDRLLTLRLRVSHPSSRGWSDRACGAGVSFGENGAWLVKCLYVSRRREIEVIGGDGTLTTKIWHEGREA